MSPRLEQLISDFSQRLLPEFDEVFAKTYSEIVNTIDMSGIHNIVSETMRNVISKVDMTSISSMLSEQTLSTLSNIDLSHTSKLALSALSSAISDINFSGIDTSTTEERYLISTKDYYFNGINSVVKNYKPPININNRTQLARRGRSPQIRYNKKAIASSLNVHAHAKKRRKNTSFKRTRTTITQIKTSERIEEISNLISSSTVTVYEQIATETREESYEVLTQTDKAQLDDDIVEITKKGNWQKALEKIILKWKQKNPVIAWILHNIVLIIITGLLVNALSTGITANTADIRDSLEDNYTIICNLDANQEITIIDECPYYYQISFTDNNNETQEGWIAKRNVVKLCKPNKE